jgi:hypothetical protein
MLHVVAAVVALQLASAATQGLASDQQKLAAALLAAGVAGLLDAAALIVA